MADADLDAWLAERLAIADFRPAEDGSDSLQLIAHLTRLGWRCQTGSFATGCWAWVGNPIVGAQEASADPADLPLVVARAARTVLDLGG